MRHTDDADSGSSLRSAAFADMATVYQSRMFGAHAPVAGSVAPVALVVTTDDVGDSVATAGALTVDAPHTISTIDTIGDQDFYAVNLVAGRSYDLGVLAHAGGPSGAPLADSYLELYDSNGALITSADGGAATTVNTANSGFDALLNYTPTESGTYYVNARAFDNVPADGANGDLIGDYEVFAQDVTGLPHYVPYYNPDSPLYAIDWGTQVDGTVRNPDGNEGTRDTGNAMGIPTPIIPGSEVAGKNVISVYFAKAGDIFTPNDPTNPGLPPVLVSAGTEDWEKAVVMTALGEFSKVADVVYVITDNRDEANFQFTTYKGTPGPGVSLLGSMSPPGESDEGLAQFNSGDYRWNESDLQQGGFSFVTLIHEFGHGHGLAHPHDNGGHSGIMRGVEAEGAGVADYTTGDFGLNQAVYTMMSYEDGWQDSPYGNAPTDVGYGYLGGLMAFDIAAIQDKYGVNEDWARNNTIYTLKDVNAAGTYYSSIWDGGGHDRIAYDGARDAVIDLRPATLRYESGGGGFVSYADGIFGGYTIANGVTIEDARGGTGNDHLIGNAADNRLEGRAGNDVLEGGGGADFLSGGGGIDTASYSLATAGVRVDLTVATAQNTRGGGSDTLVSIENLAGSGQNDILTGSALANRLDGGAGADKLFGGGGRDVLAGGAGADQLTGGDGADRFVFDDGDTGATGATADHIADFTLADTIDLSAVDAVAGTADSDEAFTFIGGAAFGHVAGQLRLIAADNHFYLAGDTDGDGSTDFFIVGIGPAPTTVDLVL